MGAHSATDYFTVRKNNRGYKKNSPHITILGGGPAGLAVGYYAKKKELPFTIYESTDRIGGNSVTFRNGAFCFDSGAHRLHSKNKSVTNDFKELVGKDLREINVPSSIYHNQKFVRFPLSLMNVFKTFGLSVCIQAVAETFCSRWRRKNLPRDFESYATALYGTKMARMFLLNYSKKLWGVPCHKLSATSIQKRLSGAKLKILLKELILRKKRTSSCLEGTFYYPKQGIGMLMDKLETFCNGENIIKNSKVTKIICGDSLVREVEINEKKRIPVHNVVSTLPLDVMVNIMEPQPPKEIILSSNELHYRDLILAVFFLNKKSITQAASTYFPSLEFPFTRVYEPKNRSLHMSPPGRTSLVAEIPSSEGDPFSHLPDTELIKSTLSKLIQIGWIKEENVIDSKVFKMRYAYPVLEIDTEEKVKRIIDFLKRFQNLKISGRSGKFVYGHIHDMMGFGKAIVEECLSEKKS